MTKNSNHLESVFLGLMKLKISNRNEVSLREHVKYCQEKTSEVRSEPPTFLRHPILQSPLFPTINMPTTTRRLPNPTTCWKPHVQLHATNSEQAAVRMPTDAMIAGGSEWLAGQDFLRTGTTTAFRDAFDVSTSCQGIDLHVLAVPPSNSVVVISQLCQLFGVRPASPHMEFSGPRALFTSFRFLQVDWAVSARRFSWGVRMISTASSAA